MKQKYFQDPKDSWIVRRLAKQSILVEILKNLPGNNILFWGSYFIAQKPGQAHRWHLDVEHGKWHGVTVWLWLKNLNEKKSISVISRTHKIPVTPQELASYLQLEESLLVFTRLFILKRSESSEVT